MKTDQIKKYMEELEGSNKFSGSILVAKENKVIFQQSYGKSNLDLQVENSLYTKYGIASITKSITAMAILLLAQQGKLRIEDKLEKYIPEYPNGGKITIYHLITHSSGIFEIYTHPEYESFSCKKNKLEELIEKFKHKPLGFEPGSKFEYSNSGYILLAYIIEMLSGQTYGQFIKENIFDRLSMNDTGCYINERIINNKANGYSKNEEEIVNSKIPHFSTLKGAGNLYSTLENIYIWANSLLSGSLLHEEFSKKLLTEMFYVEDDFYYGYGFVAHKPNNKLNFIYQDGGLPGFKSIYKIFPDKELIIVLLSNYDFVNVFEITEKIEDYLSESL